MALEGRAKDEKALASQNGGWDGEGVGGGSRWGTQVDPWLIHVNVWQKPVQYCKVISFQPTTTEKGRGVVVGVGPGTRRARLCRQQRHLHGAWRQTRAHWGAHSPPKPQLRSLTEFIWRPSSVTQLPPHGAEARPWPARSPGSRPRETQGSGRLRRAGLVPWMLQRMLRACWAVGADLRRHPDHKLQGSEIQSARTQT